MFWSSDQIMTTTFVIKKRNEDNPSTHAADERQKKNQNGSKHILDLWAVRIFLQVWEVGYLIILSNGRLPSQQESCSNNHLETECQCQEAQLWVEEPENGIGQMSKRHKRPGQHGLVVAKEGQQVTVEGFQQMQENEGKDEY